MKPKIKLIYNPHAGDKRSVLPNSENYALEDVKRLFDRYQVPIDAVASKSPEDSINLAKDSEKQGYETVVAAGGDGSVATIAHGLVGSSVNLAILPLGTVMNIARMLAIPNNVELAVALIKLGRKNMIDLGQITVLDGDNVGKPMYFVEQAGVGFDADYRYYLNLFMEKGQWSALIHLAKMLLPLFGPRIEVEIDGKTVEEKARMVVVSNGPYSGLGLKFAPSSKLNDHFLTVSVFTLSRFGLAKFIFNLFLRKNAKTEKVKHYKATEVKINTKDKKLIHADARVFGTTPAEFKIFPNAIHVITGFPDPGNASIKTRTPIEP